MPDYKCFQGKYGGSASGFQLSLALAAQQRLMSVQAPERNALFPYQLPISATRSLGTLRMISFRAKMVWLISESDKCFKRCHLLSHYKVNPHSTRLSEGGITKTTQFSDHTQCLSYISQGNCHGLVVVTLIILIS